MAKSIYKRSQKVTTVLHSPKTSPTWCICFKCEVMPYEKENVCCKNKEKNYEHPECYHLVLDKRVLDLAVKGMLIGYALTLMKMTTAVGRILPIGNTQCGTGAI